MTEEEIIKYAKIFSTAHGDTFKIHFDDKTINEPDVWKGVLDYIDKLQKENQELKEDNSHQWEERCRLTFELEELKEELDYYKQKENQEFDERDYYEE